MREIRQSSSLVVKALFREERSHPVAGPNGKDQLQLIIREDLAK